MPFVKGKISQNKNNKNKKAVGSFATNCFLVEVAGLGSRRATRLGHSRLSTTVFKSLNLKSIKKETTVFTVVSFLVGVAGLEPTASWSRTKHATKLRYTPR